MEENITIFGHNTEEFQTSGIFVAYIVEGIFWDHASRYRRTQPRRNCTTAFLCYDRRIYGRFDVSHREEPHEADRRRYSPVDSVFCVIRSARYQHPVPLADVGIGSINFCPDVPRSVLNDIEARAGTITYFHGV